MDWKRFRPYLCVRLIPQNSMFSNFCHVLKAEIEEIVNSMCDNIIIKMKQQLPQLSLDDINLITLTIAGYGAKAISLFMNAKPNTIYVRRKRLLERIAKSDAPDREWFISQINGSEPRA